MGQDLELAERVARAAGKGLLARFRRPAEGVELKSSSTDMVSEADLEAERTIGDMLRTERPEDGIIGEEGADESAASGRRWIVDPLDGTTNYLHGLAAWSVSVALEDEHGLLAGVVHDPVGAETYTAERGSGARLNGHPIEVRRNARLDEALVATGFAYDADTRATQASAFGSVLTQVRDVRRAGSAALDLAWVAAGRLDGYWERGGKVWDWAAGRLIVAEAGGALEYLEGKPDGLMAANPELLPELAALVRRAESPSR
ncbi:MAG: inositol monophosphatase family protein [Thermoleophilaceae bacterium]